MKRKKLTITYKDVFDADFDKAIEEITKTLQGEARRNKNDFLVIFTGTDNEINKYTIHSFIGKLSHIIISNGIGMRKFETHIEEL